MSSVIEQCMDVVHELHDTDNEERAGGSKCSGQIVNTVVVLRRGDMQPWNVESSLNLRRR